MRLMGRLYMFCFFLDSSGAPFAPSALCGAPPSLTNQGRLLS